MTDKQSIRIAPHLVLGGILVVMGVLFTLDNMGLLHAHDYLKYWPVLIILYGLSRLVQPGGSHGRFGGAIWLLIGSALLIDRLEFMDLRLWDFWPLLIVLLGLLVIRRSWAPRATGTDTDGSVDAGNMVSGFALMGGVRRTITSQDFRGGELTAIMGGCEVDLRRASISGGTAVLDIFAVWGGIDIQVPRDWTIIVEGIPLLGGIEDETHQEPGDPSKKLLIRGIVIMAGAEIKN